MCRGLVHFSDRPRLSNLDDHSALVAAFADAELPATRIGEREVRAPLSAELRCVALCVEDAPRAGTEVFSRNRDRGGQGSWRLREEYQQFLGTTIRLRSQDAVAAEIEENVAIFFPD